ncbi:5'-3' exonuclease H3TH domain-containing protein [Cohnella faecalis]|uniref:5'-3' exonuclease n=1 Tax=Cohnella faecalis TaxID=2315694 RepID=A0A398CPJ1_9BACL|nr:5'-3' exonuclease H3TH domain-containing protein [Cohnella faecalis]RIE04080.1 5'-3' exonuclease [Cohnella faecalis]
MIRESNDNGDAVLLVDGMALLFRAYFASAYGGGPVKRTRDGVPVNAIHGFLRYLADAVKKIRPTHLVCCWDLGGQTFRAQRYDSYKGNRPEAPEDLIPQFGLIKDVVESFGILNVSAEGYEADDCIGTLARRFAADAHVYVLTGDHDLLQIVDERISVVIMKKGHGNYQVYTPDFLMEERQMTPAQIIDMKGLMGDTSDNYPGVRGVGEKTALKLILEYRSIDGILSNLESLPKTLRGKIEADLDMLRLSRELATIHCEAPVTVEFAECLWCVDLDRVKTMCETVEFKDSIRWIG